ncbi:MAG: ATP-binding protein [Rouxiella aceris]|uniref:ATP-binding protein n=1 Tax=Rouxiella aceris TaxID=2703884 RepID=UPI00284BE91D|nr:ATP-binding protein [Rouxiella aceris]MDR3432089.1 ATP-binding protein [Rouxiella aceris]
MSLQQPEQPRLLELPPVKAPATFILQQLDLYNWGPFAGRHSAEFEIEGTAIIGATGSGKTTLVDALMTLLTAQPKYNLASTGGHESDRDLISYIRGVSGTGNASGDNQHIARPGRTLTGISARFSNGAEWVQLATLQWVDSASMAVNDRKDLWLFCERDDQALDLWLELHHEGGARAIKQYGRETDKVQVFDTKKAYLTQLRRHFEVGENAFNLLNRAAGLKQLNSIDEIFRELVLDDRSVFHRAAEVAAEFENLAAIHEELLTARRQQHSLLPIKQLHLQHQQVVDQLQEQHLLQKLLPRGFAQTGLRLWQERLAQFDQQATKLASAIEQQQRDSQQYSTLAEQHHAMYLQLGGNTIEQLRQQIILQRDIAGQRQQDADSYRKICHMLAISETISQPALQENQQWAQVEAKALVERIAEQEQQQVYELAAQRCQHKTNEQSLQVEIDKISARPDSNIPGHYHDFRAQLAEMLRVDEQHLPFVAELVEVKAEQRAWRGAIERALGGQRLRLLIPPELMQTALGWIELRDNRLHVRLLEAKTRHETPHFYPDGFSRKLNFKAHPLREALKAFLATLDRHCVDSAQQLRQITNGMTIQGLMSGSSGRFEKQDQQPLAQGWMTGFDNQDRLAALRQELVALRRLLFECQQKLDLATREVSQLRQRLQMVEKLQEPTFERINYLAAEVELVGYEQQLAALLDPNSSIEQARLQYQHYLQQQKACDQQLQQLNMDSGGLQQLCRSAQERLESARQRCGEPLSEHEQSLLDSNMPLLTEAELEQLDQLEQREREQIDKQYQQLIDRQMSIQQKLVRQMGIAKGQDSGALNEVGSEMQDIQRYLERLDTLNEEALPEKTQRFIAYLNQSSDQGVTQLLADITNEVTIIEERIADLNRTMQRVDFQIGRFLQLRPERIRHESLRTLENAQRHLRSAALQGDESGEQHYQALAKVVELLRHASDNKRTVGARALLDPRYRLQFSVAVMDRQSNDILEIRTGSQGGSGGEKEIIASYILTASLSYALCPEGINHPLFGTIVLDEAFSKSSQAVGNRIVSALHEFGLHPLFVTPNKEMRLLRDHTRSAILVHRKGARATLTSLSWQELEARARQRD